MPLFSPPPQLEKDVQAAISPFLFLDDVGAKLQKKSLSVVAKCQGGLRAALRPNEELVVIVPCDVGVAVVTSDRILTCGKWVGKQMPRSDLADVNRSATPFGDFLLAFVSRQAQPFAAFALDQSFGKSTQKYWEGTIQVRGIFTVELMDDLAQKAWPIGSIPS